jgi:hypothetical protein
MPAVRPECVCLCGWVGEWFFGFFVCSYGGGGGGVDVLVCDVLVCVCVCVCVVCVFVCVPLLVPSGVEEGGTCSPS